MGLSSASITAFAARTVATIASAFAAVITYDAAEYDCSIDPDALSQLLGPGGFEQERSIDVHVPLTEAMEPRLGRVVTITTTLTTQLQGLEFRIRGILRHPTNPVLVLTLKMIGDGQEGVAEYLTPDGLASYRQP